jgi:hypothetical protein
MKHRANTEIKNLVKFGIDENLAKMVVYGKYGMNELVEEIVTSERDENQCIAEDTLNFLVPFTELQNDPTLIIESVPEPTPEPISEPLAEPIKKSSTKRVNGKIVTIYE